MIAKPNFLLSLTGIFLLSFPAASQQPDRPNIVYILADDLGIGDVSGYNPDSKIKTPNIDGLIRSGVKFTNMHTSSSVCSPTRYGILTGRYNWRSALKEGVLGGYSPALIEPERETIASFLKKQAYQTACIGKWHLGWNWSNIGNKMEDVDYSKPVLNGPEANGFDYSWCIPASLDMPPYVYVENGRSTELPVDTCKAGTGMGFYRKGVAAPGFRHEEVLQTITTKALDYISLHAKGPQPFFLYFPLTAPHTPILPSAEFAGKSGLNAYADFVLMVDGVVKQVVDKLKKEGVYDNTMIVFTSDNGCSPQADYKTLEQKGHYPSWKFRGMKADIFDGGHRVPFVVSWPALAHPGYVSDQMICSTDFFRTIADLLGKPLSDNMAEDSYSFLKELKHSDSYLPVRESIVNHSIGGYFAISKGKWKLIFCSHSGGWSDPKPNSELAKVLPPVQLYDIETDVKENINLAADYPAVVKELTTLITGYVEKGRSTPGMNQSNTGPERWKQLTWMQ